MSSCGYPAALHLWGVGWGLEEPSCLAWDRQGGRRVSLRLRGSWGQLCGHPGSHRLLFQLWTLALLTGEARKVPPRVNDSLSALPHPQRTREESLGDWNNVTAALRRDSQPPALLPGALGTPLTTSRHRAVSGLALGTCSSFLGPAWPGRVPAAGSLSHSCTFPLPHCSRYQHPTSCSGCTGKCGCRQGRC